MSEPLALSGPDLGVGIPVDQVPEGGFVRGHAHGNAILLSRIDGAFHAVGAACTHYGAPLDEGLQTGCVIRCPWHHACFDLRTGEAVRAPALSPLPSFAVEVSEGRVRVTGPSAARRPRPTRPGPPVVVVGAGAAGAAAVEALRDEGFAGAITLIGREPGPPVDRPNLSKDYLAGAAPEEWLPLRDEAWYADRDIRLLSGVAVTRLDPAERRVALSDGTALAYGACLLATGADPVRLPIPGADAPNVFTLRSLADSRAIVRAAEGARRAVVVGASFLGLEAAASLRGRGLDVHVVAPETLPLARLLGPAVGSAVKAAHEGRGVVFHLERTPVSFAEGGVLLSDGSHLPADLVVMGVGVRPAVALAEKAGLLVDKGVVVDATLRTSAPAVWAAGDIARWPDPHTGETQRVEHWSLAQRQGQVAARNMLGAGELFDAVPFFWSIHHDLCINVVGFPAGWERVDVHGDLDARDAAIAFRRGDKTLAVATVGRDRLCLEAAVLLERDDHAGLAELVPLTR